MNPVLLFGRRVYPIRPVNEPEVQGEVTGTPGTAGFEWLAEDQVEVTWDETGAKQPWVANDLGLVGA